MNHLLTAPLKDHGLTQKDTSILIGNALDHYDSAIYGLLAPVIGPLFFPNFDPIVQLIFTFSILGTSLFTRPLGSFIFGLIAKKHGPFKGLSYSLFGLAITSIILGFLPTHSSIGWYAPLGLLLIRIVKGVFAAGEGAIAKLYIMENKPTSQALKSSYYYQSSSMLGMLLASALVTLVIASNHEAWRLCFWLGGCSGFVGLYLRRYSNNEIEIVEPPLYKKSSISAMWENKLNILKVAMATGFGHVTATIPFVFMNSFVPLITNITLEQMMVINTSLIVLDMFLIPIIGQQTLKFDCIHVMLVSSLILALTIIPLFMYLPGASLSFVIFVRLWIVFWGVVFLCPLNYWLKGLFPLSDQYLLVGMGGALGASTIGRLTTPFCLWLWYQSHLCYLPAIYLALIMFVTAYIISFNSTPSTSSSKLKTY